ncbi:MAG: [FeFe] hydrogenase H-cluster radical SAM maturase HydE [Planctomycetes bacterium]|nr:[FeFe] hydrogenase H-cluster radical SAM maturase HydE [Planctomycetota bacterium]
MNRSELLTWLREESEARLSELWHAADAVRRENVGDAVQLRGLVEISNHCVRACAYCGLRAPNHALARYRMAADEILACARKAVALGYGTVVLQSGEDYGLPRDWMADIIRSIKAQTPLAVTLSLGERPDADLAAWRAAGADRYLLRFETSNPALYHRIHPPLRDEAPSDHASRVTRHELAIPRLTMLRRLQELGFEAGSGVMIGIPGQTYDDLADDILLFRELELDMIGVGPYLPHPVTPLGRHSAFRTPHSAFGQVPNTELMTYRVLALTRLACPWANIPSTTALATLNRDSGRERGLARGANVVMPNLTPPQYRALYEIYPAKACLYEVGGTGVPPVEHGQDARATDFDAALKRRILALGRTIGTGPGASRRQSHAAPAASAQDRGVPCLL